MPSNNHSQPHQPAFHAGILIPAHNEAAYIDTCLNAVLNAAPLPGPIKIVVIANACSDDTAEKAKSFTPAAIARDWVLEVIDCDQPGKLHALNLGEDALDTPITIYLDADVVVSPTLLADLIGALDRPAPTYASGEPRIIATGSALTRAYARFWRRLPFVETDVPGFGIFAVNRAGRNRWGSFPDIIADDTFVRLHFAPTERVRVTSTYDWPLVGRVRELVRVRRRQNAGVTEIDRDFPALRANGTGQMPGALGILRHLIRDPAGFTAYVLVILLTRIPARRTTPRWVRGR